MIFNKNYITNKQDWLVPAHLNFGKFILDNIRTHGDKIALTTRIRYPFFKGIGPGTKTFNMLVNSKSGEQLTYRDLTQYSVNLGNALSELGMKKGDVVGFGSEQRNDYMSTALAVIFTGATLTLVEYRSGRATLRHQLELSKPKYIICTDKFWATFKETLNSLNFIKTVINLDDKQECNFLAKNLISKSVDVDLFEPAEVVGQTDIAIIAYSSGSTGLSKGIKLSHLRSIIMCHPKKQDLKVAWIEGDWYHTYDISCTLSFYVLGGTVIYHPEYTTEIILKDIDKYGINFMQVVPSIVEDISVSNLIEKYGLYTLKQIQCGGAPLHTKTMERIRERLPNLELIQSYGMTEVGMITSEIWGTTDLKLGSVGMVAPNLTLKVVNLNTQETLGPNQKGEIRVRTSLFKGYIGVDSDSHIDEEGFFKTGDIGYYDDDFYLFIVGRIKETINYNGYKVAPEDLERVLLHHPEVLDAGVIGKPDPRLEELPTAFIVRRPGSNVTEEELIKYVDSEVAHYMKLRGGVKFIKEIPRNPRKKILRNRLREMLN